MKRRVKRISILIVCLVMLFSSVQVYATQPIETEKGVSLTIDYQYDEQALPGAVFKVYRVAAVDANVGFTPTEEFAGSGEELNDVADAEAWDKIALSLAEFVGEKEELAPIAPEQTITNGEGQFTLGDLEQGLYLVLSEKLVGDAYSYLAAPTLVCLPNLDKTTDTWTYQVTICPKADAEKNPEKPSTERMVQKVWSDTGHKDARPEEITVHLYGDGKLYDTVKLTENGQWKAEWKQLPSCDEQGAAIRWTVKEDAVKGYESTVEEKGVTFVVTNTYQTEKPPVKPPVKPHLPQTGLYWWPVLALTAAGLIFLIIGYSRRRNNE